MPAKNQTIDKRLFFKINKAQRLLLKWIDRELISRFGVSAIQLGAVFYLMKNGPCLLKDLSRELSQNNSAITTLVERMEKNGLLIRQVSETDGRAFQLTLTDKGKQIGESALPFVSDASRQLTEGFDDAEVETIHRFLDRIIRNEGVSGKKI